MFFCFVSLLLKYICFLHILKLIYCYSQPSFCLIHWTMRTARIQLKQHPTYIDTAFYPFPYKCIHLSAFCVSKQHGHERDKVSLAALLFALHKNSTTSRVGKYCMNLSKSFLELVQKYFPHSVCSLCLCTSSALCI